MFRLVRSTQHILDVLLDRGRLALRIHDGAFSAMDLIARYPRTTSDDLRRGVAPLPDCTVGSTSVGDA